MSPLILFRLRGGFHHIVGILATVMFSVISLSAQDPYDAAIYPRFPDLSGLTAVNVSNETQLTNAINNWTTTSNTYIKCSSGADFTTVVRTISKNGTTAKPLIIIGHQTDDNFTNRAKFKNWTITGANVWICGLKGEGDGEDYALNIIGAADNATVTQCLFDGRRAILVNHNADEIAQGVRIGWNRITGNGVNGGGQSGDIYIKFEVGLSDTAKPENARVYRNLIESSETGFTDESMCIMNRPGRNPDANPDDYLEDFIVLENWIESGRRRGVYLKHGGEIVRNYCDLTGGSGLVYALRGRGTKYGRMFGNIGKNGSGVVVQGYYDEVLGNDFGDVPEIRLYPKFLNNSGQPNSIAHGADGLLFSKNIGTIRLGYLDSGRTKLANLGSVAQVYIEEHSGAIKDDNGNTISWDGSGHPTGTVPNVLNSGITKRASATVPIPDLTTITQTSVGPGAPAFSTNLLQNPGFESGITPGWTAFQCTLTADTTDVFSGTIACKATARNANYEGAEQNVHAILQSLSVGDVLNCTAKFKNRSATAGDAKLVLVIFKSGGNQYITLAKALGINSSDGWVTLADEAYQLQAGDFTGMTDAKLSIRLSAGTADYSVDDVELRLAL